VTFGLEAVVASRPIGVLLIQLGTPDQPTPWAVCRYLREFLWDPRVIEAPRWIWWWVLHLRVLPFRSFSSAAKYARIWDPNTGSPLLYYTRRQATQLQALLGGDFLVRFAMRYGHPSIQTTLDELTAVGVERLVVLPLYPQYSATTTGSACDSLFRSLMKRRRVPAIRIAPPYYDEPGYIEALALLVERHRSQLTTEPEMYLFSFHGIPLVYVQKGDPYPEHVQTTARLLAQRLGLADHQWMVTFQSRFGRAVWLQPYTDQMLVQLAQRGVRRVLVVQPGFTADCLETVDEIGHEAAQLFRRSGGDELWRCPCLNDQPEWIQTLAELVLRESSGWLPPEKLPTSRPCLRATASP
jgi:ferrochelatase